MKKVAVIVAFLAICLAAAGYTIFKNLPLCGDSICQAHAETNDMLDKYDKAHEPEIVYTYFAEYRGEAPGSEARSVFAKWGNKNQDDMTTLLQNWPEENRTQFFESLRFAAEQSGTEPLFEIPNA